MENTDMRVNLPVKIFTAVICVILVAPIAIVVVLSFGGDGYMHFPPASWSTRWYRTIFMDPAWMAAMLRSLVIAFLACLVATSVGFLGAYGLVRSKVKGKKVILSIVLLPMIVPTIISSIGMYFLAGRLGLVGSRAVIAVCHAVIALPVVVLILMSALQNVDLNLERAAYGLGAGQWTTFRRIVFPLAFPGIVSAALFSFLTSFDEVVISLFLSGVTSETLPVRIWNSMRMDVDPTIAAVNAFLVAVTIVVLLLNVFFRTRRLKSGRTA